MKDPNFLKKKGGIIIFQNHALKNEIYDMYKRFPALKLTLEEGR